MTGLSGSGKSTLATELKRKIKGLFVLDGDCLRAGINNDLGFSLADRLENIRRIAHIAKMISDNGHPVVVPTITPTKGIREQAEKIVGNAFHLLWIKAPLEVCQARDPKGLYEKVAEGSIKNFTGVDSPFDEPNNCNSYDTDSLTVEECTNRIIQDFVSDFYSI